MLNLSGGPVKHRTLVRPITQSGALMKASAGCGSVCTLAAPGDGKRLHTVQQIVDEFGVT